MTINQLQDEIIEEFNELEWIDRYQMIIDYGKDLTPFPEELRNEQNLIDGCQSQVWFTAILQLGSEPYLRLTTIDEVVSRKYGSLPSCRMAKSSIKATPMHYSSRVS